MVAILIAFGLVGGIVKLAVDQANDPTIRRFLQKRRLVAILKKREPSVTLSEAEDGLAITRYLGDEVLHRKFEKIVASKKGHRPEGHKPEGHGPEQLQRRPHP